MTTIPTTVPAFLRIADILCPAHREIADDAITWPFADNDLGTPRADCTGCAEVFHDVQVQLGEGRSAHVVVFPDLPEADRRALHTSHEAGHVVADIAHGLTVNTAYVDVDTSADYGGYLAYDGGVNAYLPVHVTSADYAVTHMAGTAAAERFLTRLRDGRPTAADRIEMAFEALSDVNEVRALDGIDVYEAFDHARDFVAAHWNAIEAVSQHLHTHQYANGTDLTALCGALGSTPGAGLAPRRGAPG